VELAKALDQTRVISALLGTRAQAKDHHAENDPGRGEERDDSSHDQTPLKVRVPPARGRRVR
jgi:hypothetical protein